MVAGHRRLVPGPSLEDYREVRKFIPLTSHGELSVVRDLESFKRYLEDLARQEEIKQAHKQMLLDDIRDCQTTFADVLLNLKAKTRNWKMPTELRRRVNIAFNGFPEYLEELKKIGPTPEGIVKILSPLEKCIEAFLDFIHWVNCEVERYFTVDLPPLVDRIIARMKSFMDTSGISLEFIGYWPDCCEVSGTGREYTFVIENLISNSLHSVEKAPRKHLSIRRIDKPYRLVLEVEDTGCGMDPELKRRIFSERTTTRAMGSGEGLYRSAQIMKDYDGIILLLKSELQEGTCLRLEFTKIRRKDDICGGETRAQS
jgi:signal transduction histidine kinase